MTGEFGAAICFCMAGIILAPSAVSLPSWEGGSSSLTTAADTFSLRNLLFLLLRRSRRGS